MTATEVSGPVVTPELQFQVEQFLYYEAGLLDDSQFRAWFGLLADDIEYVMPIRPNRLRRDLSKPSGLPAMAHFDEDKASLDLRVRQLESGKHWAEEPPSRTRHLVTNVRIRPRPDGDPAGDLDVTSNFLCYRNRLDTEVDIWAGQREDVLRRHDGTFRVTRRTVLLDQAVVLSKNLSVFF